MKTMLTTLVVSALLALSIAGCAKQEEPAPAPTTPSIEQRPAAATSELGTEKLAGHYNVKLSADPAEPRAGKIKFTAEISHHGQSPDMAKVTLRTAMPGMEMDIADVDMKSLGGGKFEGTADLRMAGKWEAKVLIQEGAENGEVTFKFEIKE